MNILYINGKPAEVSDLEVTVSNKTGILSTSNSDVEKAYSFAIDLPDTSVNRSLLGLSTIRLENPPESSTAELVSDGWGFSGLTFDVRLGKWVPGEKISINLVESSTTTDLGKLLSSELKLYELPISSKYTVTNKYLKDWPSKQETLPFVVRDDKSPLNSGDFFRWMANVVTSGKQDHTMKYPVAIALQVLFDAIRAALDIEFSFSTSFLEGKYLYFCPTLRRLGRFTVFGQSVSKLASTTFSSGAGTNKKFAWYPGEKFFTTRQSEYYCEYYTSISSVDELDYTPVGSLATTPKFTRPVVLESVTVAVNDPGYWGRIVMIPGTQSMDPYISRSGDLLDKKYLLAESDDSGLATVTLDRSALIEMGLTDYTPQRIVYVRDTLYSDKTPPASFSVAATYHWDDHVLSGWDDCKIKRLYAPHTLPDITVGDFVKDIVLGFSGGFLVSNGQHSIVTPNKQLEPKDLSAYLIDKGQTIRTSLDDASKLVYLESPSGLRTSFFNNDGNSESTSTKVFYETTTLLDRYCTYDSINKKDLSPAPLIMVPSDRYVADFYKFTSDHPWWPYRFDTYLGCDPAPLAEYPTMIDGVFVLEASFLGIKESLDYSRQVYLSQYSAAFWILKDVSSTDGSHKLTLLRSSL